MDKMLGSVLLNALLILALFNFVVKESNGECFGVESTKGTCIPGPRNAAKMSQRTITSTSTCGRPVAEYCRVQPLNNCFNCNASDPKTRHPAEYLADQSFPVTWWQSETWWQWHQTHPEHPLQVNVTISFNKSYDLTGQIMLNFYSPRPNHMILEKSTDKGLSWRTLQYYADNCKRRYSMNSTDPTGKRISDFGVYCTEKYSKNKPQVDGRVIFDFLTRYTEETFFRKDVQSYLHATDLRFRLEYPGTDGFEVAKNKETLRQYFYAISDTEIVARCKCNGHAQWCDYPNFNGKNCACLHGTAGDDCERCLPLYNNRTWQPASSKTDYNPCQKCECYDHADSCVYKAQTGFGVCENCKHNTTGLLCEKCQDKSYRNVNLSLNHPKICPACNCFQQGIINNGTCNSTTGQCECRQNVTGRQCDHCAATFWGYTLPPIGYCTECHCVGNGTVNGNLSCNQYTGQCTCKPNVHVQTCSQCRHGFYSFPKTIADDCHQCNCDYGGSVLEICSKSSGNCICRKNIQGPRCTIITPGYFTGSFSHLKYEAEFAMGNYIHTANIVDLDRYFTGIGYGRINTDQFINFRVKTNMSLRTYIVMRYTNMTPGNVTLKVHITGNSYANCSAVNITLNITGLKAGNGQAWRSAHSMHICKGQQYNFNVSYHNGASANTSIKIDSLILLPDVTDTRVYRMANTEGAAHGINVTTIIGCWNNALTLGSSQQSQPICKNVSFSAMAEVFDGALACRCNSTGTRMNTTCDQYGGQCHCQPGVTGRMCDRCMPGYYDFSSQGCKPCNCSSRGSSQLVCDPVTGQCPCKPGVVTRTCGQCNHTMYGFTTGKGCVECKCNASGSADMQCDDLTGNCTCKNSTTGAKCDQCRRTFFNFTTAGCQPCNCHTGGSEDLQCDLQSGVCLCKTNAQGLKCDQCKNGTYNSDVNNPDGCAPCFCYGRSSTCTSARGFVRTFLESYLETDEWSSATEGPISFTKVPGDGLKITFASSNTLTMTFPSNFTENQVNSYGELLVFELKHTSNGVLDVKWFLEIERSIAVKVRFLVQPPASTNITTYYVRLHEAFAETNITAYALQSILADIFNIKLRAEFGSSGSVIFKKVQLHTASKNTNGIPVGHVENCTCTKSNYTALSCELCSEGYTRTTPRTPRFGSCELCRCTGRSKKCDGETGVCRDCRMGSEGTFCERCQKGVDNTTDLECTRCFPEFWGLKPDSNGCAECDCLLPNTLYGNNTICNMTHGQCVCKARISGRTCDRCHENAYNTTRGCIDCPECYWLLQVDVNKLRTEIKSLNQLIERIKNGDIGDVTFAMKLKTSITTVGSIARKATNSTGVEEKLFQELMKLNQTLNQLERTLKTDVTSGVMALGSVSAATHQDRNKTQDLIRLTTDLIWYSYNILNTSIESAVNKALSTSTYLAGLVPRFSDLGNVTSTVAAQQNKTGMDVLNKTSTAEGLVQSADAISRQAIVNHNETSKMTRLLQTQAQAIKNLSIQTNTTAHQLNANVSVVLSNAIRTLEAANAFNPDNSAAVTEVMSATKAAKDNASSVINTVKTLTQNFSSLVADSEKASTGTATLVAAVKKLGTSGKSILVEAQRAQTEAQRAVDSAAQTHKDALEMRQILLTFEQKASESEQLAKLALARSKEANRTSMSAIAYSQRVNASIQATLRIATQGLAMATRALNSARTENQGVAVVHLSSTELKRNADSSKHTPDYLTSVKLNATNIRSNIQNPIEACKKNYSISSLDAKVKSKAAERISEKASKDIRIAKRGVDRIMSEIPRLQTVNTTRLRELQREITRLRAEFTATNAKEVNAALRAAKDNQQLFIDEYKKQVRELRRQVDEMKVLQSSLSDVPHKGCS